MNITAKELSGQHIGQIVSFPGRGAAYTGRITKIVQYQEETAIQIRDRALYGVHIPNRTPITIQEGQ